MVADQPSLQIRFGPARLAVSVVAREYLEAELDALAAASSGASSGRPTVNVRGSESGVSARERGLHVDAAFGQHVGRQLVCIIEERGGLTGECLRVVDETFHAVDDAFASIQGCHQIDSGCHEFGRDLRNARGSQREEGNPTAGGLQLWSRPGCCRLRHGTCRSFARAYPCCVGALRRRWAVARAVQKEKCFFVDSGLGAHLAGWTSSSLRRNESASGQLLEGFVIGEVCKQLGWSQTSARPYHYRDRDAREVDLIPEARDGRIVAIEVKAGATVRAEDTRHLRYLRDSIGNRFHRGIVLSTSDRSMRVSDSSQVWSASAVVATSGIDAISAPQARPAAAKRSLCSTVRTAVARFVAVTSLGRSTSATPARSVPSPSAAPVFPHRTQLSPHAGQACPSGCRRLSCGRPNSRVMRRSHTILV